MDYYGERRLSPVSYWVHAGVGEVQAPYQQCTDHRPTFPPEDPLKGFPYLTVAILGFDFEFASMAELDHCVDILEQKNLPSTSQLCRRRGSGHGPNSHWLSRLPGRLKAWPKRVRIVAALREAKAALLAKGVPF